ncbi:MAG: DNA polymerase III subunit delta [Candidatus Amulumruptor caecigallinarius]|nr:DNA polymerase III subunit delta [Candidatus Amulumruptor caecigallinarius]
MKQLSYRDIIRDVRNGKFEPVYILMGEEAYYIDLIVQNIEKYAVAEDDRDFDYNMFFGNDADIDYVIAAARQFPIMSDRKLVILKEAQSMVQAKAQLDKFAPYVANPSQTTVFVIAFKGEPLSATSKLLKAAKESDAVVFKSELVKDWNLPSAVRDYCNERKVSIEEKAIQLLCECIGSPLSKLFGEVNKLISICGGNGCRITCEDIEKNIGISKDFNNLELVNALSAKDYPKAMKIVKYFEQNPKNHPTVLSTSMILNFFSNLIVAHYMLDKSDDALREQFGFKAKVQINNMRTAMRNYSAMQAVNGLHYLREFDTMSKGIGSMQNEYALMKEMIFKMFT